MKKGFLLMLALVMLGAFCACSAAEQSIIGTWYSQNTVLGVVTETSYTFNEDGTGTRSALLTTEFSYYFEEDKLVLLTKTLGIEKAEEYLWAFEGEYLVLTGENETLRLARKS